METYPQHTLVFKERREIARDTYEFSFEKPEGFEFIAGQNTKLYFRDLPEEKKHRTFTIASAPHEKDLLVAMRIRESAFKKRLMALKSGDTIEAEGPTGHTFFLHEDSSTPTVFIAGGIGIVPAFSILKDVVQKGLKYSFIFFYSNRNEEDISYKEELEKLALENKNVTLAMTLTKENPNDWQGEHGYITEAMIGKYVPSIENTIFYVSGPPDMLEGMKQLLSNMNIKKEKVFTKRFGGY